jgi:hypothetical protein
LLGGGARLHQAVIVRFCQARSKVRADHDNARDRRFRGALRHPAGCGRHRLRTNLVPPGPPFFRFSDDAAFSRLLHGGGLDEVQLRTISSTHKLSGADELWDVIVRGTVRMRALLISQPEEARARIRAALDRVVGEYATDGGIELPVSIKLAAGRRPRT